MWINVNKWINGVSEQFCDDKRVPYHQVRLYLYHISYRYLHSYCLGVSVRSLKIWMKVFKLKANLYRVSSHRSTMWSVVGVVVARTVVVAARRWVVVWIVVGWGVRAGLRPRGRTILPDMRAHWWHSVVSCAQVAPKYAHRTRWRLDLRFTTKD